MFHYNGNKWTEVSSTLQVGYAVSDGNVWAFSGAQVAHFNGHKWTTTNVAKLLPPAMRNVPAYLTGIIALAPNSVYATGEGATTPRGGPGVVLHFNGHTWSRVAESGAFEAGWASRLRPTARAACGSRARASRASSRNCSTTPPARSPLRPAVGAEINSVSRIPGTAAALAGGGQPGTANGTSVVLQYS